MPKYKSLLKAKAKKPRTQKAGSVTAGSVSAGSISAGAIKNDDHFDEVHGKVFDQIEKNPELLVHMLELLPESAFHLIQEVSRQHMGNVDKYHVKIVEKMDKSHDLHAPHSDIANNAKNMKHLIDALKAELHMEPSGGGLFKSISRGFRKAAKFTNKAIKKVNLGKIQHSLQKVAHQVAPIIKVVDATVGHHLGLPKLAPYFDKGVSALNNPRLNKAIQVQNKAIEISDKSVQI